MQKQQTNKRRSNMRPQAPTTEPPEDPAKIQAEIREKLRQLGLGPERAGDLRQAGVGEVICAGQR